MLVVCYVVIESEIHALVDCPHAEEICEGSKLIIRELWPLHQDLLLLLVDVFKFVEEDLFRLDLITLWSIWFDRNQIIHGKRGRTAAKVISWAEAYFEEVCDPQKAKENERTNQHVFKWIKPKLGWWKLNSHAAIDSLRGLVGFGFVIRNSEGKILVTGRKRVRLKALALVAEAMAIRFGTQVTKETGLFPCLVESNRLTLINVAKGNTCSFLEEGTLAQDLGDLVLPYYVDLFSFCIEKL